MTGGATTLFDAPPRLNPSLVLLALLFVAAGVLHLVKPAPFVSIVPRSLPAPRTLVILSGVFEILGGVGVLVPSVGAWAGWGLIALLVAVFPANIQMLIDAHSAHASRGWQAALILRLPLQVLLIAWVYAAAIRTR